MTAERTMCPNCHHPKLTKDDDANGRHCTECGYTVEFATTQIGHVNEIRQQLADRKQTDR